MSSDGVDTIGMIFYMQLTLAWTYIGPAPNDPVTDLQWRSSHTIKSIKINDLPIAILVVDLLCGDLSSVFFQSVLKGKAKIVDKSAVHIVGFPRLPSGLPKEMLGKAYDGQDPPCGLDTEVADLQTVPLRMSQQTHSG